MNFGQALAALANGRSISNTEWERPGMFLAMQQPTGNITEPFIAQHLANGVCRVYNPTQGDILSTTWTLVGEKQPASLGVTEHEHAGAVGQRS
jgi:hypothetical protein